MKLSVSEPRGDRAAARRCRRMPDGRRARKLRLAIAFDLRVLSVSHMLDNTHGRSLLKFFPLLEREVKSPTAGRRRDTPHNDVTYDQELFLLAQILPWAS